jgi:hypothetical protein
MEMEQIVKIIIFVVVLVILIGAVIFLLKGKGGSLLDSVRRLLRVGR